MLCPVQASSSATSLICLAQVFSVSVSEEKKPELGCSSYLLAFSPLFFGDRN